MWGQTVFQRSAGTPLREHRVLRSDRFDEAHAFLRNKDLEIQPTRVRSLADGFRAAIDAAYLPNMYVAYMEYSAALQMTSVAPLDADYSVHLPLDGWIDLRTGNRNFQCGGGGAVVVSPSNHLSLTASGGCKRLLLSVKRTALTEHLTTMLGELPSERLIFDPDAETSDAGSQRLANAVRYAAQEFERKDSLSGNAVVTAQFEQFIMTLLLMSHPNNYSEALDGRDDGVRPKDVKKAIDYIQANLGLSITMKDLVTASGVPGRTLHQHFQDFVGTSPMGYIRNARFERVRNDLARLNGEDTVTQIASLWGFTHMGRFSAEYRRRFGELPSVTSRRRASPRG